MDLPDLGLDFYGATIEEAVIGPRRELRLTFRDMAGNPHSRVRFGGIANLDEVRPVFETPPVDGLHSLRYAREERSKPGALVVELEFDRRDERCLIRCSKVEVTAAFDPQTAASGEV
jgi:hypothetical protein